MNAPPYVYGVFAAHSEPEIFLAEGHPQLFKYGQSSLSNGLGALAEDGNPSILLNSIATSGGMSEIPAASVHGVFNTATGAEEHGPLLPGQTYTFSFVTNRDTPRLSLAFMLVQSQDWFVATPANGTDRFQ